jgi:chromosome partitioning protein
MIITFANQKGGVGKTTLGLHVAAELARRGQRVKVIDLDPQHSALDGLLETDRTKAMPE